MKQLFLSLFVTLFLVACSDPASNAAAESKFIEGVQYEELSTPIDTHTDANSVMEFFWYGCPHCEKFEPTLLKWQKNKPDNSVLIQSPAIWSAQMELHAKVFFIIQALENKAQIHHALFEEVMSMVREPDLNKQTAQLATFLAGYGLSKADFMQQLSSNEINQQLEHAIDLMDLASIKGTPTVIVNGRYKILNEHLTSEQEVMDVANFLIARDSQ